MLYVKLFDKITVGNFHSLTQPYIALHSHTQPSIALHSHTYIVIHSPSCFEHGLELQATVTKG